MLTLWLIRWLESRTANETINGKLLDIWALRMLVGGDDDVDVDTKSRNTFESHHRSTWGFIWNIIKLFVLKLFYYIQLI